MSLGSLIRTPELLPRTSAAETFLDGVFFGFLSEPYCPLLMLRADEGWQLDATPGS